MVSLSSSSNLIRNKKYSLTIYDPINDTRYSYKAFLYTLVKEIKEKLMRDTGIQITQQRLMFKNVDLSNELSLDAYGILDQNADILILLRKPNFDGKNTGIVVYGTFSTHEKYFGKLLEKVRQGFNKGLIPNLTFEGTSGTYILRDAQNRDRAVFKPIDEEAYAPNNPRGYTGQFKQQGFRNGVLSGEACIREVIAYIVDQELHFYAVPKTTFVQAKHPSFSYCGETNFGIEVSISGYHEDISKLINPKVGAEDSLSRSASVDTHDRFKYGSLQEFMKSDDYAENFSSDLFPVDEVHKIAILDYRILNTDRNEGNILVNKKRVKSGKYKYFLIPIDHGMSLPSTLDISEIDYCWMSWNQARVPFSKKCLDHIDKIDIEKDINLLNSIFYFRPICLRNMRISCTLLKEGAKRGLTLEEISQIWCRDYDENLSVLEHTVHKARQIADRIKKLERPFTSDHISNLHLEQKYRKKKERSQTLLPSKTEKPEEKLINLNYKTRSQSEDGFDPYSVDLHIPQRSSSEYKKTEGEKTRGTSDLKKLIKSELISDKLNVIEEESHEEEQLVNQIKEHMMTELIDSVHDINPTDQNVNTEEGTAEEEDNTKQENYEEKKENQPPQHNKYEAEEDKIEIGVKAQNGKHDYANLNAMHAENKNGNNVLEDDENEEEEFLDTSFLRIKRTLSLPTFELKSPNIGHEQICAPNSAEANEKSEEHAEIEKKLNSIEPFTPTGEEDKDQIRIRLLIEKQKKRKENSSIQNRELYDSAFDQDFFRYFEEYIVEEIEKKIKQRQTLSD